MFRKVGNLLPTYAAHISQEIIPRLHRGGTQKSRAKRETSAKYGSVEKLRRDGVLEIKFGHFIKTYVARGGVVVKVLRYKPAGRRFDSRWCHWNFSVT